MDAELVKDINAVDANVIVKKLLEKISELTFQNAVLAAQLEKCLSASLNN